MTDRIRLETHTAGGHVVRHSRAAKAWVLCFSLGFAAVWTWVMLGCPVSVEQLGLRLSGLGEGSWLEWCFLALPLLGLPALPRQLRAALFGLDYTFDTSTGEITSSGRLLGRLDELVRLRISVSSNYDNDDEFALFIVWNDGRQTKLAASIRPESILSTADALARATGLELQRDPAP